MKTVNIILFTIMTVMAAQALAGDLGGGGSTGSGGTSLSGGSLGGGGMGITLEESEKQKLISTGTAAKAFAVWLNQMSEQQKVETMKKVFDNHVLPQLISQ